MPNLRATIAIGAALTALTPAAGASAEADRPAGGVFSWGQELRQQKLPGWRPTRNPYPAAAWRRIANGLLATAGRNGLWFSGSAALPFDLPIRESEPTAGWFTPANYRRLHQRTGVRFDVNLELRVAKLARDRGLHRAWDIKLKIPVRRYNILSPGWQRTMLREIRRLVPKYRSLPYRSYYTGADEPMVFPPFGPATRTPFAKRFLADVLRVSGQPAPDAAAAPTTDPAEGLRWLGFNRFTGARYFALRKQQADLVHRLDPNGLVSPNSYAFIDGFVPWDYTQLGGFADVVELDPYVSYDEAVNPGRGRYNPGFGTKLMADLTGRRVRTIIQAFPYQGYDPAPEDVWTWATQALRAGATDLSLYGENNPRFRKPSVYRAMLDIARSLRDTRLPPMPADPASVVVYATASEAQGRPDGDLGVRPRTRADALYTTYAVLGERAQSAFRFDSDVRLTADPARLAAARTVWLPRGETLDPPFARALLAWVQSGGTLIVTDPAAFTRAPDGSSLTDVRQALVGADVAPGPSERIDVPAGAVAVGVPAGAVSVPVAPGRGGAFTSVPAGASVVGTNPDGSTAVVLRPVGAGQVLAFAGDVMFPKTLDAPGGVTDLAIALLGWRGSPVGVPAWRYEIPGNPSPGRLPWPAAVPRPTLP